MNMMEVKTISTRDIRSSFDPATAAIIACGGIKCRDKEREENSKVYEDMFCRELSA